MWIPALSPVFLLDLQMCFNRDWQRHTRTHTHAHRLRHALSSNTPPLAEGRLAHLWLLTPGASHLLLASFHLSVQSSGFSVPIPHRVVSFCFKVSFLFKGKKDFFLLRRGLQSTRFKPNKGERKKQFPQGASGTLSLVRLRPFWIWLLHWG